MPAHLPNSIQLTLAFVPAPLTELVFTVIRYVVVSMISLPPTEAEHSRDKLRSPRLDESQFLNGNTVTFPEFRSRSSTFTESQSRRDCINTQYIRVAVAVTANSFASYGLWEFIKIKQLSVRKPSF